MKETKSIILKKNEGQSYWVLGDRYTFKATGVETNGTFTVIDQFVQPQGGPPPHVHHREDEMFYVLEGRFSFLCGDVESVSEAGSFLYVPKGLLHTFKNLDSKVGRLLVTITPAGLEEFFYAIGSLADDQDTPPPFDPAVLKKIIELAPAYYMDVRVPSDQV